MSRAKVKEQKEVVRAVLPPYLATYRLSELKGHQVQH